MRVMVVIEFNVPTVEAIADVLLAIDPPNLPYFVDGVRVVPGPFADELVEWLDEE
jgi:hypothetical protein